MGKQYNYAHLLIEVNDIGAQVADILHAEMEYEHILVTSVRGRKGQTLDGGFGASQTQYGVRTTTAVKRLGCSILKSLIEEDKLLVDDFDTISELVSFVATKDTYAADVGHHDDLVICLVLFGWLTTQSYFKDLTNLDLRKDLYHDKIQKLEEEMTPFGFIEDGITSQKYEIDADGGRWDVVNFDDEEPPTPFLRL